MAKDIEAIRRFRLRRQARLDSRNNNDGGNGSGNWGHVGVLGQHGGSASGGGGAFRMTDNNASKKEARKVYTSQNKIRRDMLKSIKKAESKGNAKALAKAMNRCKKVNMKQKSVRDLKKFDPHASQNILADKNRGANASERQVKNVNGTREAIRYTFKNTNKYSGKKK